MARETQQGNTKHDDQSTPRPLGDAGRPRRDPGSGSPVSSRVPAKVTSEPGPLTPSMDLLDEIRRMIREEVTEAIEKTRETPSCNCQHQSSTSASSAPSPSSSPSASPILSSCTTTTSATAGQGDARSVRGPAPTVVTATHHAAKPGGVVRFSDRRAFAKRPTAAGGSGPTTPLAVAAAAASPSDTPLLLIDEVGRATPRAAGFMRVLAEFMIEEFPPKGLVITPRKLACFYARWGLDPEPLPFAEVFSSKAKDANERITDLYCRLDCAYYLVPADLGSYGEDIHSGTHVPGLTPEGFSRYLTACLRAYPDEEFRRLERIATEGPDPASEPRKGNSSGSNSSLAETLPRPLIRSLLPARHDAAARKTLLEAFDVCLAPPRIRVRSRSSERRRGSSSSTPSTAVVVQPGRPEEDSANRRASARGGGRHSRSGRLRGYVPASASTGTLHTIDDDDGDTDECDRSSISSHEEAAAAAAELRATAGKTPAAVKLDHHGYDRRHSDGGDYFDSHHHHHARRNSAYQARQQPERHTDDYQDQRGRRRSGPTSPVAVGRYVPAQSENRTGRYKPASASTSTSTATSTPTSSTSAITSYNNHSPAVTTTVAPGPSARRASYPVHAAEPLLPPPVPQAYSAAPRAAPAISSAAAARSAGGSATTSPTPVLPPPPVGAFAGTAPPALTEGPAAKPNPNPKPSATRQWLVGQKREVAVPGAVAGGSMSAAAAGAGKTAAHLDRGPTWDEVLEAQRAGTVGAAAGSVGMEMVSARRGVRGSV